MSESTEMFAVYRRPRDFPQLKYVVRRWVVTRDGPTPEDVIAYAKDDDSLAIIRRVLAQSGLMRVPHQLQLEDSAILETWL